MFLQTMSGSITVHPKAAKRFIPFTIWIRTALNTSLNRSAFIVAAAEILAFLSNKRKN